VTGSAPPYEAIALESDGLVAWPMGQADAREGVEAFLGHRAPDWKLRKGADLPAELLP
jgi:hypothetical protein